MTFQESQDDAWRIIERKELVYSPDISQRGKLKKHDTIITIYVIESAFFDVPVLMSSDLHHRTIEVFKDVGEFIDLSEFIAITVGDMSGKSKDGHGIRGSDGISLKAYQFILKKTKSFYFVQGNHDLPSPNRDELKLRNRDGTRCALHATTVHVDGVGTIGGVDGIISRKRHPYKFTTEEFFRILGRVMMKKVRMLVTHETPAIVEPKGKSYIGNKELFEFVMRRSPQIHVYGHCHHADPPIKTVGSTTFINADARVLLFIPFQKETTK